jgi:hypothetical protein
MVLQLAAMSPQARHCSSHIVALVLFVLGCGETATPSDRGDAAVPAATDAGPPYANVTAVSVDSGSDGTYTLAVSIESSDIDCSQFANWWEVLSPEGALLYRRILDHSHTDANGTTDPDAPGNTFTRTGGPVAIAASDTVIVRAHMSNGGYAGSAMRGSVSGGFAPAPDIGPAFAAAVETAAPQPTGCSM